MKYISNFKLPFLILSIFVLIAGIGFYFSMGDFEYNPVFLGEDDLPDSEEKEIIVLKIGESGTVNGITITPKEILEDSRCPTGVSCIQAGRIRIVAHVVGSKDFLNKEFLVGEPVVIKDGIVTLLKVDPEMKTSGIDINDYRFVFKVIKQTIIYKNASKDMIRIDLPYPGAVTGKQFKIIGEARGYWFFEASFPIEIKNINGKNIITAVARAKNDWMTEEFVPFEADISIPDNYTGEAILILKRDNPSDIRSNDASVEFPITVEY